VFALIDGSGLLKEIWMEQDAEIYGISLSLYQFSCRAMKLTLEFIVGYHCYQFHTEIYGILFSQGNVHK
jgi:hypothetical protein